MTKEGSLIKVSRKVTLGVSGRNVEFVLFNLLRSLPDDCMRQSEIKRVVQTEHPEFVPLNASEVAAYSNGNPNKPLFALGSLGYSVPPSEGGFVGTREIQPGNGKVQFREHWCLGGNSFEWDTATTFIMKVRSN